MFSALESKLMKQIEHGAIAREIGRSCSPSEDESQASKSNFERYIGEWKEEDNVLPEDSRGDDEGEDNTDEGDEGSAEGSASSSSDEQADPEQGSAPNSQQPTPGGTGGNPPSDRDGAPKKKKKNQQSSQMSGDGEPDLLIHFVQQGGDNLANRKRRNPQVKDLKELAKDIYDTSSPGQPIDVELFQKVYDSDRVGVSLRALSL